MATRPLDAAFGGSTTKKSKKRGAILAVGIVAGLASIGSIFAASISVNGGVTPGIEFSQGVTTIAACDTDGIMASLGAVYDNAFKVDTITLTEVNDDCDGGFLTLSLYDTENNILATVTGTIPTSDNEDLTTIEIGAEDFALISDTVADGTPGNVLTTPSLSWGSGYDAGTLASSAAELVIEITG
jgi:hypothetical protein